MARQPATAAELRELLDASGMEREAPNQTRAYRAIRWLGRAETEPEDDDIQFILLWIAFNALYANDLTGDSPFAGQVQSFFTKLVQADKNSALHELIWVTYPGPVRTLLDNKFAFKGYWAEVHGQNPLNWERDFANQNERAQRAVGAGDVPAVYEVVFARLYTLRNQLVHGGSTHNSSLNRLMITDGRRILASTVPVLIQLVIENPTLELGPIHYPPMRD